LHETEALDLFSTWCKRESKVRSIGAVATIATSRHMVT
jgi:hypothetical protein